MPLGMLFWILMILWFVFGVYSNREQCRTGNYLGLGGSLLLFILFFIVGWKIFGFVVQ